MPLSPPIIGLLEASTRLRELLARPNNILDAPQIIDGPPARVVFDAGWIACMQRGQACGFLAWECLSWRS